MDFVTLRTLVAAISLALLLPTHAAEPVPSLFIEGYALLASRSLRTLRSSGLVRWIERAFGAALIFFGVRLVAARS
jgi:threonine/homoserine/homoserine lactone efflux protein